MAGPVDEARQGHSRAGMAALALLLIGILCGALAVWAGLPWLMAGAAAGFVAALVLGVVGLAQKKRKRLTAAIVLGLFSPPVMGVLAAVAIPAFLKYIRRAKTSEATMNLARLYDSSVRYFDAEHGEPGGAGLAREFPVSTDWTPPLGECCRHPNGKCPPDPAHWDAATWKALDFRIDEPHYYSYRYLSDGSDGSAAFTAAASGDLNCNGVYSTFERIGTLDAAFNISGSGGIFRKDDLE